MRLNAKALPVDGGLVAALVDVGDGALLVNAGLSGANLSALWCCAGSGSSKRGNDDC